MLQGEVVQQMGVLHYQVSTPPDQTESGRLSEERLLTWDQLEGKNTCLSSDLQNT